MCTENNRRLARFYRLILGMEEVWNYAQNSPHAFYVSDGYFNLNCLQIHRTMAEQKRDIGINHYGFKVECIKEIGEKLGQWDPPIKFADRPKDGRYTELRIKDPDGNGVDIAEKGWGAEEETRNPGVRHVGIRTADPERPADFYKFVFAMKEVGRSETAAGAAIDIFHSYFRSTDGYAVIWPVVAIPVLAVIPLVALLAEAEGDLRGTARHRAS